MVGSRILQNRRVFTCALGRFWVLSFEMERFFRSVAKKIISWHWSGECSNSMVGSRILRNRPVFACVLGQFWVLKWSDFSLGSEEFFLPLGWGMPRLEGCEPNFAKSSRCRLSSRAVLSFQNGAVFSLIVKKIIFWHWSGECSNLMVGSRILQTGAFLLAF